MKKLSIFMFLVLFTAGSVHAADWNFYGSARISTFYTNADNDLFSTSTGPFGGATSNTKNYEQNLNGNARIGARVHVSDSLTGQFEYGALGGEADMRLLWGEWHFGKGSLGVGQHYTPLLFPYSNQVYDFNGLNKGDHNMSTFGVLYGNRKPMIRLKFGQFQIAAVQPRTLVSVYGTSGGGLPALSQPATQVKLPSIQAKYKFDFDTGHISLAGGYQNFDVVSGANEYEVTSYILGIGGRLNVGAAYFKGCLWGGQNVGNMADILVNGSIFSTMGGAQSASLDGDGFGFARYSDGSITTAGITDRDALAALIVAGYEIRKGLYLEAGYGYTRTELDNNDPEDDAVTYYVQSTIFLAPGVFITPEIGRYDAKQAEQPVFTYFGVKWQINF